MYRTAHLTDFHWHFKQQRASIFSAYEQGMLSVSWVQSVQKCLKNSCSNRILAHWVSVKTQNYKYCSEDGRQGEASREKMILKLKIAHIDYGMRGFKKNFLIPNLSLFRVPYKQSLQLLSKISLSSKLIFHFSFNTKERGSGARSSEVGRSNIHCGLAVLIDFN